jgi:hypothetical protein
MRRVLSALMLLLAAGPLVTAASASAGTAVPAVSASAGTAPSVAPAPGEFGVRLFDVPVADLHNPRGLRYITDFLPSGTVIHRRILVLNEESQTAHFTVYPDAAKITHGDFIGDAGHTRSELTSWISVQHPSLTLGPHSSTLDTITIRVPRHATRGEHYGEIWVQQVGHRRTSGGVGITEVARVGIRIYLAVGHGAPPTRFAITSVTGRRSASGQPLVVAHVRNTGGRAVDLSGQVRLSAGPGGITAGPFPEQQIITLAPGQADNLVFALKKSLPSGPWLATVTLVSGFTTRTAHSTIQFRGGQQAATAGWAHRLMTWGGSLIAALGVLALALVLVRGRGRRTGRVHA